MPFRTVSVVAQTSGPVTQVNVMNGQRESAGDLLFKIEDSNQKAALKQAEAEFGKLAAAESKAALVESGLPYITLLGRRGGSARAAAAVNALASDAQ